ncbi:MAG: hypothetical protein DMF29_05220 [Verrucomicrobia bacterium]|nr:MAG: hypothetical protein DMF29_05220 [Verrucomicrobiota bacterium]
MRFSPGRGAAHIRFSHVDLRYWSTQPCVDAIGAGKLHRLILSMFSETIELRGHFIDSLTLPKVLDQIVTRGATFNIVEFKIGQKRVDQSFARIEITAPTRPELDELIQRLREQGAEVTRPQVGDK